MRIGLSTSVIQQGQTGVSRYVFALLKAFRPYLGQHQFVLFVLEKDQPLFASFQDEMELVPVPEKFRPPHYNILWHQTVLPRLVRHHRLNVLHVPSYRRMLWPKPCPLVATIHDLAPFHVRGKYDWKRMLYGRYGARFLAHRQDQIIAISQNTAEDIVKFFQVPPGRLRVIHNGVDHEQFYPAPAAEAKVAARERFGLEHPFFLYVSRLEHPGKNHLRLIAAFSAFKARTHSPWQLALAGKDWTGAEMIHAAVHQSPVAQDIRLLGFVADQHLSTLYRAAEALVCPSLHEGFGLPLVEAMACGCPVLCSRSGSLAEIVGSAALTVDAEDVAALEGKLAQMTDNVELRAELRRAGLLQARKFDWATAAAATLDVYAQAMLKTRCAHEPLLAHS